MRTKQQIPMPAFHFAFSMLALELIINDFFIALQSKQAARKNTLLIMDEVDGMSSGDRGGVAELILMIRNAKVSEFEVS